MNTATAAVPAPSPAAAAKPALFDNYTRLPQRVPESVWMVLRLLCLGLALGEIALLFWRPELGLRLFWAVAVPCLPALFAVAPGLWRQVCPMAFVNQVPRLLGFGLARTLPGPMRYWSYIAGIVVLIGAVILRRPVLNATGWATGAMCAVALAAAFVGGVVYKGRSGWCGTFCPLAPVQRSHGQAPLILVRNGWCPTCVGCQKNCFDFNPRAAIFGDLNDSDPRHAQQRVFFMAMLPGLIWGYYTEAAAVADGPLRYALVMGAAILTSCGGFVVLRAFFKFSTYRLLTAFGVSALLLYYWFAGPVLVNGVSGLLDVQAPATLVMLSRFIAVPICLGLWRASLSAERAYRDLEAGDVRVRVEDIGGRGGAGGSAATIQVHERQSGKRFATTGDKTLLEAMEAAGVPIDFGCRSGLCGADPVGIVDGHANLSAPGGDELATLRRLGLTGRARLACCVRTCGPATIDCDARSVPVQASAEPEAPRVDQAAAAGVHRVVIVGNGVAGMTVAEALRSASDSVEIDVVSEEPHHFYNRMALGRVIYNRSAMDGLFLVPDAWYKEQRVNVWLNTVAVGIDREKRQLRLGTGDLLPYDRLVLATGAAAAPPAPGFANWANCFLLRDAADAQQIRAAVQRLGVTHAVVIGGGVLGVEAAEALQHLGLAVTLLHRGARLMDRQLDAEGANCLVSYLQSKGITPITGAVVEGFDSDDRMRAVRLKDGQRIEAGLFVACAGIVPHVGLAREAGLAVGRGIRVDAGMRTDDPAIMAVGDVAEPAGGGLTGLWPVAVDHGRKAVASIFGQPLPADAPPPRVVLQLKSDGVDLRSFGDITSVPEGAEVLTPPAGSTPWWRLLVQADRIVAAVFVGPPGSATALTRLLQAGGDVSAVLPALRAGRLQLPAG